MQIQIQIQTLRQRQIQKMRASDADNSASVIKWVLPSIATWIDLAVNYIQWFLEKRFLARFICQVPSSTTTVISKSSPKKSTSLFRPGYWMNLNGISCSSRRTTSRQANLANLYISGIDHISLLRAYVANIMFRPPRDHWHKTHDLLLRKLPFASQL